jgi:hypothetical protein
LLAAPRRPPDEPPNVAAADATRSRLVPAGVAGDLLRSRLVERHPSSVICQMSSVVLDVSKPWEGEVAKGQMRSNKEKKKPKADKNKKKNEMAASPFAAARVPGKPGYAAKKNP